MIKVHWERFYNSSKADRSVTSNDFVKVLDIKTSLPSEFQY